MSILFTALKLFLVGLAGWAIIVALRVICYATNKDYTTIYEDLDREIIADGNNLFSTAFIYSILCGLAANLTIPIVVYAILIVESILCISPIISALMFIVEAITRKGYYIVGFICRMINSVTPLIMVYLAYSWRVI